MGRDQHRAEGDRERAEDLREPASSELTDDHRGQNDGGPLRQRGKETEALERAPEDHT